MKKCPNCGANLQDDDNYCVYCGKNVEDAQTEVNSDNVDECVCQYCHKPMDKDAQFCPSCGMERNGFKNVNAHPHDKENSPFKNYLLYWKGYFDFKGRTSRKGFWDVFWINLLVGLVIGWICPLIPSLNLSFPLNSEYLIEYYGTEYFTINIIDGIVWPLITFFPGLAIAIRRLRDTGKPWYAIFIYLVPIAGPIIYIIWLLRPSDYFKYNHR